jgi:hypothetical protein
MVMAQLVDQTGAVRPGSDRTQMASSEWAKRSAEG